MNHFPVHTVDSAPEGSRASLQALQGTFGMIPNILGTMATSPMLIDSLVGLFGKVHGGSFSEDQVQVVLLTNAVANESPWPVAFHSALALQAGVAAADHPPGTGVCRPGVRPARGDARGAACGRGG